jgi:hypothetical protein
LLFRETIAIENHNLQNEIIQCANSFLGAPYDQKPIGEYVDKKVIVYDDEVDCMYFVFRCTEIAIAKTNNLDPIEVAKTQRFKTLGIVENTIVQNYDNRFDYAEDMTISEKWGKNVSATVGKISTIAGTRMHKTFEYVAKEDINYSTFQNGDIIFFVKNPEKRVVDEIIAHLGFVEVANNQVYLIHASGAKRKVKEEKPTGEVKKVLLKEYLVDKTNFIGVVVKRLS